MESASSTPRGDYSGYAPIVPAPKAPEKAKNEYLLGIKPDAGDYKLIGAAIAVIATVLVGCYVGSAVGNNFMHSFNDFWSTHGVSVVFYTAITVALAGLAKRFFEGHESPAEKWKMVLSTILFVGVITGTLFYTDHMHHTQAINFIAHNWQSIGFAVGGTLLAAWIAHRLFKSKDEGRAAWLARDGRPPYKLEDITPQRQGEDVKINQRGCLEVNQKGDWVEILVTIGMIALLTLGGLYYGAHATHSNMMQPFNHFWDKGGADIAVIGGTALIAAGIAYRMKFKKVDEEYVKIEWDKGDRYIIGAIATLALVITGLTIGGIYLCGGADHMSRFYDFWKGHGIAILEATVGTIAFVGIIALIAKINNEAGLKKLIAAVIFVGALLTVAAGLVPGGDQFLNFVKEHQWSLLIGVGFGSLFSTFVAYSLSRKLREEEEAERLTISAGKDQNAMVPVLDVGADQNDLRDVPLPKVDAGEVALYNENARSSERRDREEGGSSSAAGVGIPVSPEEPAMAAAPDEDQSLPPTRPVAEDFPSSRLPGETLNAYFDRIPLATPSDEFEYEEIDFPVHEVVE